MTPRQIVSEEWERAVKEFNLRPGSITEKVVSRIVIRVDEELPDLLKYANHLTSCRYRGGHDCDCGLEEIRAEAARGGYYRKTL
jgi:hypothetical protein